MALSTGARVEWDSSARIHFDLRWFRRRRRRRRATSPATRPRPRPAPGSANDPPASHPRFMGVFSAQHRAPTFLFN
eukprot:5131921-Pyramimonas_sp.AAC.1